MLLVLFDKHAAITEIKLKGNNASINFKREHSPGNPRGFAPVFSPGPGDLYHLNCPGVGLIIKVPSCQTDLPSIATL